MTKRLLQVIAVIIAFMCVYTAANPTYVVRTEYTVKTEKVTEPYKVVLISDAHYGCVQDKRVIDEALSRINEECADVVILDGDIVQSTVTSKEDMKEAFSKFGDITNRDGIYFVCGNHDMNSDKYYSDGELLTTAFMNNIYTMDDDIVTLPNNITLIGRANALDPNADRKNIADLVMGNQTFTICADHTPIDFVECAVAGVDLQLSGHTHGGQLFPLNLYVLLAWHMPVYGETKVGHMPLIVTSGMGVSSFNLRNLHHCEYVVINLIPR